MRALYILSFIFALPFLAVLGHDLYNSYYSDGFLDLAAPVKFSDLGWLWLEYHRESYHWAATNIDPGLWHNVIDPFLENRAIFVTLVPLAIAVATILILKLVNFIPKSTDKKRTGKQNSSFSFRDESGTGKAAKYKRK